MKTYAHPSKSVYLCNKNEITNPITKYVLQLLNVLIFCLYVVILVEVEAEADLALVASVGDWVLGCTTARTPPLVLVEVEALVLVEVVAEVVEVMEVAPMV